MTPFARCRAVEGGVQLDVDTDTARLLYVAVDALAVTDAQFRDLDRVARALRFTLQITRTKET